MAPRISIRFPWAASSSEAWATRSAVRALSSTAAPRALGPQSPNYIEVPKPKQPSWPERPTVQGHLPIPRDIFKTRNSNPKESDAFIKASTPVPQKTKAPGPYSKDVEYRLYKQRLAEKRRSAFEQGVKQLHERKVASEAAFTAKIQREYAHRRQVAFAPPREADVLTQTSIDKGIRDYLNDSLSDSSRAAIIPQRRQAYARRMAKVKSVRASRLHDLYTNARQFIVDEAQLDEAIDAAFGTDEQPVGWDHKGNMGPRQEGKDGLSPWQGPLPEGVSERLNKLRGGEGVGLAKDRVRKVAEELTGGKM